MGIIWDVTRWVKSAANTVKNAFTQKPTITQPEKTLNDEANKIVWQRMPTLNVGSFANTLNNQINTGQISPIKTPQVTSNVSNINLNTWATVEEPDTLSIFTWQGENILSGAGSVVGVSGLEEEPSGFQKLINNISTGLSNYNTRVEAKMNYTNEYETNKKRMFIWYNPNLKLLFEMVPSDEGAFNARVGKYFDDLSTIDTLEEYEKARDDLANDLSWEWQFKSQMVPFDRKDGLWSVSRDTFTSDELSYLSNSNVSFWTYKPNKDEILSYVDSLIDNDELWRELEEKYKDKLTVWIDLSESDTNNEVMQRVTDIAEKWVLDKIYANVVSEKRWAAERNARDFISDQFTRLMSSEEYLRKLRDEAALTPELQRTQYERDIIYNYDVVWKQLMDKYASNINDWLSLQFTEWVNDMWEVEDVIARNEDWEWVAEMLRNWLDEIAGIDIEWWWPFWVAWEAFWKVSAIDIMRRFANEAAYNYRQWELKDAWWAWVIPRAWNWFEHALEPQWERLTEGWQAMWARLPVKIVNTIASIPQWRRWWNAPSAAFIDADASVGKLIETDDSTTKRTIKKYSLQFAEYVPEWLWAAAPDLLLTFATQWWTAPLLLRNIPTFSKIRNFKRVSDAINEWRKIGRTIDSSIKWLERARAVWREWASINTRNKRIWNIVDRTLTQFAIWQSMDARLSAFDTEPYSDTSFWLSMWGSLLWDILPEAKDIWWVLRKWTKWWKALTKWTWVWDLVDFISQSDENALEIARAMKKKNTVFTEEDLKSYVRQYATITDAAKRVYDWLSAEWKVAANQWTKELMYNYVKQAYKPNSYIGKAVRAMVENNATNPADIIKFVWWIPWTVSVWPYKSVIRLSQWTMAWVAAKEWWWYNVALDVVDGWFGNKVTEWFTFSDIQDIAKLDWYEDILENRWKYFRKVTEKTIDWKQRTRWLLNEAGLDRFWLEPRNLTLASLWIEISWAENARKIFKEKMKDLEWMKLSDDTIEALADNGWYDEVVSKISNILCD